jgi:hypothetical protein
MQPPQRVEVDFLSCASAHRPVGLTARIETRGSARQASPEAMIDGGPIMTYRIEGLSADTFERLRGLSDEALAAQGARRVVADAKPGFPCRVTLEDAEPGETLILFNYVSHDVPNPYRNAYAIYVREQARQPACFVNELPPALQARPLGLRAFDDAGTLRGALLALPGEADAKIQSLLARPEVASIHAHNAAHGCFAARIVRD